jgi:hypothetical protein
MIVYFTQNAWLLLLRIEAVCGKRFVLLATYP